MIISSSNRIFIGGGAGMAGQSFMRLLAERGCVNVLAPARAELDLCDRAAVHAYFEQERPELVIMAAGLVGGIQANIDDPVGFLSQNMLMAEAVLSASHRAGVEKLLYLGSSCIYPKQAELPLKEDNLLTGPFEPTNEGYALAKTVGIRLAQYYHRQFGANFISVLPTNLYGPADRYDPRKSHVVPALIQRFHQAKVAHMPEVVIWGTGKPLRDLLYVDDLVLACLLLIEHYSLPKPVNIASGTERSIAEIAHAVAKAVGYEGKLVFDASKPDGLFRKPQNLDTIKALGWAPKTDLEHGLQQAYTDYLSRLHAAGR